MDASLVEKARAGDLDAFGELVTRFQDMACGCAYAVLGDFHLAQDAAQEAFLEAYRNLPRVEDPRAFPGWFRRIVLHRCNRLTRRKSVPAHPMDQAAGVASPQPDPAAAAERRELRETVLAAIRALPENDRNGDASVPEGLSVFHGLEMSVGQEPGQLRTDPLWADEWRARHDRERRDNANQYGLAEPTRNWLGIPVDINARRVFEIRDITRRLGLSPFDMIKWTEEGLPAVRCSPYIRWDVERVTQWLAERGPLPKREYTIKELDSLEDFVIESVAAGAATPQEARDVLACWMGTM